MRIGIDLGGTKTEAVLLDGNREAGRLRVPTPRGDYDETLRTIASLVGELDGPRGPKATVGVGIPGAISPATGLVKNANSTWLLGKPLREDLERILSRPVRLANDADCFTLSEAVDGAGKDFEVVFGVILGTGTGGGIAVGKRILSGRNAVAGEWGHNPLPWPRGKEFPGPSCYCGKRGCIETFLSGPGLRADHGESIEPPEIAARAERGDPRASATMERYHDRAARALASVVNILDPDAIVLGGGMSRIPSLYEEVPRRWGKYVFSDRVETPLLPAAHGDSSGVRGAAWQWREEER